MLGEITFQYPTWYYLLCLALGAGYAFALYYRDKKFYEVSGRRTVLSLLSFLRFAVVSIAAFLLLAPLLKSRFTDEEKPVVVLVHDNSSSILTNWSSEDSTTYRQSLDELRRELGSKYDLDTYVFGSEMIEGDTLDFSEKATDISAVMERLYNLYTNRNVGAVILATDGIFNKGSHPMYARLRLQAPIFTIGLGDTVQRRDLRISRTYFSKIVYLNDRFNVQLDIQATNAGGERTVMSVYKVENDGSTRKLQEKAISISDNSFLLRESLVLDATQAGPQRYRITLSPLSNEVTLQNNTVDIFIDVLDSRKKVLILANSPHPDISAIRQGLEKNRNYEVTIGFARDFSQPVTAFNLVILHQLPSLQYPMTPVLKSIRDGGVASLFVLGKQSSIPMFNQSQQVIEIRGHANNVNEVQATFEQTFSLFTTPGDFAATFQKFPPLIAPFGEYHVRGQSSVLFRQKIGAVTTNYPLVLLDQSAGKRTGLISGEGIWRWRLYDFLQNGSHDRFDDLMSRLVQFLSLKEDKRRFRVVLPKHIFNETEQISLDAEFYNESYELINDPDARLVITDQDGREFPYQFNKSGRAYHLDAGRFAVGNYSFRAETGFDGKLHTFEGQFSVSPLQLEALQTTADHRLLYNLSAQTGGAFLTADRIGSLADHVLNSDDIKPVIRESEQTRAFINLRWIFFILLALLSIEWFIRKWLGSY